MVLLLVFTICTHTLESTIQIPNSFFSFTFLFIVRLYCKPWTLQSCEIQSPNMNVLYDNAGIQFHIFSRRYVLFNKMSCNPSLTFMHAEICGVFCIQSTWNRMGWELLCAGGIVPVECYSMFWVMLANNPDTCSQPTSYRDRPRSVLRYAHSKYQISDYSSDNIEVKFFV